MKRKWMLLLLVGAAGVFASVFAVFAQSPPSRCPTTSAIPAWNQPCGTSAAAVPDTIACKAETPTKPASSNEQVIDELTAILKETKSAETFIVTTMVLARMGPEARRTLPVVIRNAERLELLQDLFDASASSGDSVRAQAVFTALEMMVENNNGGVRDLRKSRPAPAWNLPAPATAYMPPTGYPISPPSVYYSAPAYGYPATGTTAPPPQPVAAPTAKPMPPPKPASPIPDRGSTPADYRLAPVPCSPRS